MRTSESRRNEPLPARSTSNPKLSRPSRRSRVSPGTTPLGTPSRSRKVTAGTGGAPQSGHAPPPSVRGNLPSAPLARAGDPSHPPRPPAEAPAARADSRTELAPARDRVAQGDAN